MPRPVKIGVGMRDKRARIMRSLDKHIRWLRMAETLAPWTPPLRPPFAERPRYPARYRSLPAYVYPVELPELARRCPGPEALSDEQVAPYRLKGRQEATARALAFIETFRRRP